MNPAVLITGSSGGIGRALCAAFEHAGYAVVGLDRKRSALPAARFVRADLDAFCASARVRRRVLHALRAALRGRPLRALVNNAAVQTVKPFDALTVADWQRTLNVNLLAPVLITHAFRRELARAGGSVVNIASIHAALTKPRFAAYATSKAALVGLTRSLAVELGSRIRVNAICPAAVDTPMLRQGFVGDSRGLRRLAAHHPARRIGTAEEVAALAVFLASGQAGFVNGVSLAVDGGIAVRLHDPAG